MALAGLSRSPPQQAVVLHHGGEEEEEEEVALHLFALVLLTSTCLPTSSAVIIHILRCYKHCCATTYSKEATK